MRVLGIDTSLRSTGLAVVEEKGSRLTAVESSAVKLPARCPLSECLVTLGRRVTELMDRARPEAAAIEGVFFCKNARTSLILGEARGAVITACAARGLPIYEYAPRRVKQAVVGYGTASKVQVQSMVVTLLGLRETPQEDEGDALAIAICHLHNRTRHDALMPKAI